MVPPLISLGCLTPLYISSTMTASLFVDISDLELSLHTQHWHLELSISLFFCVLHIAELSRCHLCNLWASVEKPQTYCQSKARCFFQICSLAVVHIWMTLTWSLCISSAILPSFARTNDLCFRSNLFSTRQSMLWHSTGCIACVSLLKRF